MWFLLESSVGPEPPFSRALDVDDDVLAEIPVEHRRFS